MRLQLVLTGFCLYVASSIAASPVDSIRIDSVDQKYAVEEFSFEVNPENGRVGIRLEYSNPQELTGLEDTGDQGPLPRIATLRNLKYDSSAHAVVYQENGKTITCAIQTKHWTVFGRSLYMKPTGACVISSRVTDHSRDNGWNTEHLHTLDTYLEISAK